ncbi:mariner Mos1 transposase [Trichonephila clavipes]|nr:mariner Mos1 transposase [Trichonephila clavipes]
MSAYEPNSRHLREVLIFCFNMKKSAGAAHRMLSNTYREDAISEGTCREWFQRFKNGDFEVEDQHGGGREKVLEDAELEALLDQGSCQTQQELSGSLAVAQQAISKHLKVMGMFQKQGNWVPYELKSRDVERRLFACE